MSWAKGMGRMMSLITDTSLSVILGLSKSGG